ncbi:MAG: hypothetical protein JSW07_09735, partial [bacterium]
MHLFISTSGLALSRIKNGHTILDLPAFVKEQGFDGFEISDRELSTCSREYAKRLHKKCLQNNCGIILDINVDLTFPDKNAQINEIEHGKAMIRKALEIGAKRSRMSLGGQSLSLQNLITGAKRFKALCSNKKRKKESKKYYPMQLFKFFAGQLIFYLA